jgi:hypothetical protein
MVQGPLKQMQIRRSGARAALFFIAWFVAAGIAVDRTWAADAFTVEHVEVDATAASAAAAREKATVAGQQEALQRLFDRLTPNDQRAALPHPSAAEISDLVRDFAVEDEKASAVRYLASLSVRFRPDDIRMLLRRSGVPFAETMSKPVVIVPLFKSSAGVSLWDGANPWREAWQNTERDGLVPFVVPLGDLDDTVALDAARAQSGDREGLTAIAWRYKAGNVIVATAEQRQQSGQALSIQLTTARFDATGNRDGAPATRTITADGSSPEAQWRHAAAIMAEGIEDAWKRTNLIRFDSEQSLVVNVPLGALGDLLDVRKRLGGVSFVRSYDVLYLARDAAQLRLNYFGDEHQLSIALAQSDLTLDQDATSWVLRRSGASRRVSTPDPSQVPRQP